MIRRGPACKVDSPQSGGLRRRRCRRGFRWNRLLESGQYASIEELAAAERINPSYLGRVMRLSLLAPAIVEDLLDGRNTGLTLVKLLKPFPIAWSEQKHWAVDASPERG